MYMYTIQMSVSAVGMETSENRDHFHPQHRADTWESLGNTF